tara:strand:+ start:3227 stop:7681 length:4455 start_codon:yes stop_codon:yes gene_type:complete
MAETIGDDPNRPKTYTDLVNQFTHNFSRNFSPFQIYDFVQGDTFKQKMFRSTEQFENDYTFDSMQKISDVQQDWHEFLLPTQSEEEYAHVLEMLQKRASDNAMLESGGLMANLGAISGFLTDPFEAPLYVARTAKALSLATASVGVKEAALVQIDPSVRTPKEALFNTFAAGALTASAVKLQKALSKDIINPEESFGAAKRFDSAATELKESVAKSVRVENKKQLIDYIKQKERFTFPEGNVANDMIAFVDALPEAFISGAAFKFRSYSLTQGEMVARYSNLPPGLAAEQIPPNGLYNEIYDLVTVLTNKEIAPDVFRHEVGHRVMTNFLDVKELEEALKIYGKIPMGEEISSSFLQRYPANEQFKEWFAESFSLYWGRVLSGEIPRAQTGIGGLFENVAKRIRSMTEKYKGTFSEQELMDNFFSAITRRGDKIDVDKYLATVTSQRQQAQEHFAKNWDAETDWTKGSASLEMSQSSKRIKEGINNPTASDFELAPAAGLENLLDSPLKRLAQKTASPIAKRLLPVLAELPVYLKGNFAGQALGRGVDAMMRVRWIGPMSQAMKSTEEFYKQYRIRMGASTATPITAFDASNVMNKVDFLTAVGRAKKALDDPGRLAEMPQEAIAAAREWHSKIYQPLGEMAKKYKMFSIAQVRELNVLKKEIGKNKATPAQKDKIKELEEEIKQLDNIEIRPSFLNRIYDINKVNANKEQLMNVLLKYGRTTEEAENSIKGILGQKPLSPEEEILGHGKEAVGRARSLKTRTLDDIPDQELDFVLESNIFSIGDYYTRRMGADVELTRAFGSIDLYDELKAITAHWNNKIDKIGKTSKSRESEVSFFNKAKTNESFETIGYRGTVSGTVGFQGSGSQSFGSGIYIANSFDGAKQFGTTVKTLSVNVKNPIVLRTDEDIVNILEQMGRKNPETYVLEPWLKWNKKRKAEGKETLDFKPKEFQERQTQAFNDMNAWLKEQNYDSIIIDLGGIQKATRNVVEKLEGRSSIDRRFGQDQIIVFDKSAIKEISTTNKAISDEIGLLEKRQLQELDDVRAIRDRIRGTYGLPDDPNSWAPRTIRAAKMMNAMSLLTGALAQVPDIAMLPLVNGISRTFGTTFEVLINGTDALKLSLKDAQLAGEALDMYLSTRAAVYADLGEVMGTTSTFERTASKSTQLFFTASGMNPWNVGVKTLASLMAGSRIYDEALHLVNGTADAGMIRRLARANINKDDAKSIIEQFDKHGLMGNHVKIAKADDWDDIALSAKEAYLAALSKEINLTIVTPGKAEIPNMLGGGLEKLSVAKGRKQTRSQKKADNVPLTHAEEVEDMFMGPQMSQMLFQFKTFGAAAAARIITPALQAPDKDVIFGLVSLVGLGAMVDSIRREQLGTSNVSLDQRMWSALERSAVLGNYGEPFNIAKSLIDPRFGLSSTVGAMGGPIVQQGTNAVDVLSNVLSGNIDQNSIDAGVDLLPMSSVFYTNDMMNWLRDSEPQNEMVQ